ncbi:RsmB/NOP family class I SAM-dependent RNA methyltransferase [Mesorhizobium sp. Z1-4]|uniref:RsmB/NOP family class I SAM-dependent RNA methyltransferase n=1 Tax=Mesorhizobium sp. Z1-4 TaxID=2448478 RepID=UPI000FD9632B|nr:RsmB/NOP family class I SAM-dependent RNA methyltransferase [Mesorhizobium sp. Z1-4]
MVANKKNRKRSGGPGRRPSDRENVPVEAERPGLASRVAAARLLAAVIDKATALDALTDQEHGHPQFLALDQRDRALVRAILVTALRYRGTITALIEKRLQRPLPANARTLDHILHVAAAQMLFLDVPDSAAVDLAVSHANSDPRSRRFASLVNAVLRELGRRKERALPAALAQSTDAPGWFVERLREAYGAARADAILAIHRLEPPMDFTVKSDPQGWAEKFGGIVLENGSVRVGRLPAPVAELPGYAEGEWWVQDMAATLPAAMLGNVKGKRVLDLCAAPGGKTAQLTAAGAIVTAVDLSASRLKRLAANFERLKLKAEIVEANALSYAPDMPFDAVLLDAPCSSTGTVRRHPDVPWTKTPADIAKLADLQRRMLDHAVRLIKTGGVLVFANCSLDPLEGEQLVESFLADNPEFAIDPVNSAAVPGSADFVAERGWLRTTPEALRVEPEALSGCDGFFAARLVRHG